MTAARPTDPTRPAVPAGITMRELLASCAAADAVSRPPRDPEPRRHAPGSRHQAPGVPQERRAAA
ncbi:hypothetical protein ACGFX8_28985 [Streptomyces sp. NPDC048362]|uniref:hypothetical protein n=1 Tax=Streptomyces sp. NPDC048362 TaxID=3365539 RepID=UPI00371F76D6